MQVRKIREIIDLGSLTHLIVLDIIKTQAS